MSDLASFGTESATSVAKAAPEIEIFITKNSDDASKIVEAISQTSKQFSKSDEFLPVLVKSFDIKTIDKIANTTKSIKDITKTDYARLLNILDAAGKKVDPCMDVLSTLSSIDAQHVLDIISAHNFDVDELKNSDDFLEILKYIPSDKAIYLYSDNPVVAKLLRLSSSSGKPADEILDVFKRVSQSDPLGLFDEYDVV